MKEKKGFFWAVLQLWQTMREIWPLLFKQGFLNPTGVACEKLPIMTNGHFGWRRLGKGNEFYAKRVGKFAAFFSSSSSQNYEYIQTKHQSRPKRGFIKSYCLFLNLLIQRRFKVHVKRETKEFCLYYMLEENVNLVQNLISSWLNFETSRLLKFNVLFM